MRYIGERGEGVRAQLCGREISRFHYHILIKIVLLVDDQYGMHKE